MAPGVVVAVAEVPQGAACAVVVPDHKQA